MLGLIKPLVLTVHGIRTFGHWQKTIGELLSRIDFHAVSVDYGYFGLPKFIPSFLRRKQVEWFVDEYDRICKVNHEYLSVSGALKYPSVVAHSFGTYLVAQAMLKYPQVRFNKVILAASILPSDFPWEELILREQCQQIRHEYGGRDRWAGMARFLAKDVGDGGVTGYGGSLGNRFVEICRPLFNHGDYFHPSYMETQWLPFLSDVANYEIVQGAQIKSIEEFLSIAKYTTEIDHLVYGELPGYYDHEVSMKQAISWFDSEPDIYTFLFDRAIDRCIGYINTLPVSKATYELIIANGVEDDQIIDIESFESEEVYLYAISIAIDPRIKKPGANPLEAELLLHALFGKLEDLAARKRTRVKAVAAIGWTKNGNRLCTNILGMTKVGEDRAGHPIYQLEIDERLQSGRYRTLRHFYDRYKELGLTKKPLIPQHDKEESVNKKIVGQLNRTQ